MSVVACRVTEKGYTLAADSITTYGWTQTKGENAGRPKLFEVNGIVIGGVGKSEDISLLQLFCATRQPAAGTEAALLEFMSEFSDWKDKKTNDGKLEGGAFLLGFAGAVFVIHGWDIEPVNKYMAIGAGMDYALAALHLGHSAEKAVETAIELSVYCEGPVKQIEKPMK